MSNILDTSIKFLKGVGPNRAEVLQNELGVSTYGDLLEHYPFRYVDKSQFHKVSDIIQENVAVQLRGRLIKVTEAGFQKSKRLTALFEDDSGSIELVWFKGAKWIKPKLNSMEEFIVFGKPSKFKGKWNMAHPEIESLKSARMEMGAMLKPIYGSGEKLGGRGLNSNGIEKLTKALLLEIKGKVSETLPPKLVQSLHLISKEEAVFAMHAPKSIEEVNAAHKRLKFEELFYIQLILLKQKIKLTDEIPGVKMSVVGDAFNSFYNNNLGFELTNAQKRVIKEIRRDVNSGKHMNRLLQGDVGSGKTIVALLIALLAIDNGFQVCIMAPTEILANQHYQSISEGLFGLPVKTALLTGSTKTAARRTIHAELEEGTLNILIGTHALIEPKVKFKNLGIAIIDEQHRFGVAQRAKLWAKAKIPPHVLVMTATPIPRTLAMTLYGDLDLSVIDELPPGRKSIETVHRSDSHRMQVFQFIEDQIEKGHQIYIVYPLINESEALDYKDLMDGYESISRRFPLPDFRISIVHGQMKPKDKDFEMKLFAEGKTQILVATTVIEVGVNVPNATVMIVESAERFGLSQLHQLRGRVGRGGDQSYCILMTGNKLSSDARTRLSTMCRTSDGFEIAEVDLQIRGPGDMMGTQQSGILDLKIADISKDQEILKTARHIAIRILEEDPDLEEDENVLLKLGLEKLLKSRTDWSQIS